VANEIINYFEMCRREGVSLQREMNSLEGRPHAVVLMSVRRDAKYQDRLEDNGETLIYEGHDAPRTQGAPDPKTVDQPDFTPGGSLTENGKFRAFAADFVSGKRPAKVVRVYEKLHKGIWSYNGAFLLTDCWQESDGRRQVFKFRLRAAEESETAAATVELSHRRVIPSEVKQAVFKRDAGKCVRCGATTDLHFDHVLPYSKGGTSMVAENVQLLCAKHNLQKRDRIE
jgi:hypothetical protein